jgi:N-acylneuraminate cytidylyltransferase
MENGAFYISRVGQVRRARNRLSGKVEPFVMPSHTGLELDDDDDWVAGEALMRQHGIGRLLPEAGIRLVLTDVDGVLTDGGMYYAEDGGELKRFNTLDGKAFELLREQGVQTGIVTAERTALLAARARKVGADHVYQGVVDKLAVVKSLCSREGIAFSEVAYVGDDLGDLELLRAVGFSACPSTAVDAVKAVVHHVCDRAGGEGCVREIVEGHEARLAPASRS